MTDRDPGRLPPPPRSYRWLVFACISVAMFANYYVFDALNPVGPHLEKELGFTQAQIGLLDSVYNIAALIVLLIGGIIIDRVGTKRSLVALGIVAAAGGLLIALSPGGYTGMAARPVRARHGLGAPHRRHHDRPRQVVQGQGTVVRDRPQPDVRAPRIVAANDFAQLGVRVLHRVAAAAVPGRRHRRQRGRGSRGSIYSSLERHAERARTAWVTRAHRRPAGGWRPPGDWRLVPGGSWASA